mmetsp:Transcript_41206/g.80642  ORF Transcript_41206/g.80642 Transcript_41206/m.80642 type:complete len:128 (+) Transcript_41206:1-384(+)
MSLIFTGEITNPFQNSLLVSRYAIQMEPIGSFIHDLHPFIEICYALAYFPVRAFVGPLQIVHITYDLLFTRQGRDNIPIYVSVFCVCIIWGIILGSIPWVTESLDMIKDGLEVKYNQTSDYGPRYEL